MQLSVGGRFGHHLIRELQKLLPALERGCAGVDMSGGYLKSRKQIQSAMSFGSALEPAHQLAIVRLHIIGGPLQSLNAGLFVHTDEQCFFRRIEIESHNIRRFGGKFLVRADTPGALPLQTEIPSLRKTRHTACTDPLRAAATAGSFQQARPGGGDFSRMAKTRLRKSAP